MAQEKKKALDCVVCGSCTVDIVARPVSLMEPIGVDRLHRTEPIVGVTGGLVSNAGIAMARLGVDVGAFSRVGRDPWGQLIRRNYQQEQLDTTALETCENDPTSVTIVLVDEQGQRSFVHSQGAPRRMDADYYRQRLPQLCGARCLLIGYYSLLPQLEPQLPELLAEIRRQGTWTALDSAGDGGAMQPLDRILPHLDYYVPSLVEANAQTGESDPERILDSYRRAGAAGVVGVKLGERGALLQAADGSLIPVSPVEPPGPVVDTTGAGDAFFAGLLAGQLQGRSLADSGRLGATMGAWCVTGPGASAGLPRRGALHW